jgi:quercetin dioxygenase-like cupin family protein
MRSKGNVGMKRLIDAFRGFFADAAQSGSALAGTARFALEHVDWSAGLQRTAPATHPVADRYLARACAATGPRGSSIHAIATALMASADGVEWQAYYTDRAHEPDMAAFSRNFTATTLIGAGATLPSDRISAGLSLQAPDAYYPPHAHEAEESYWIVGGDGDWRIGCDPWFAVRPGDMIHHPSRTRHAMQTNRQPLLMVWLWTSHLNSEVLIVRG